MAKDTTLLLVAGLGALYFLMRPKSAFAYPPANRPPTGSSPGGGGFSMGSGGSGGGGSGAGGGSYQYQSASTGMLVNCPGDPSCPQSGITDSGDPCDPSSVSYDPQLCNVMLGTDSQNICDPASYFYNASYCTGSDTASNYPIDTGDPCDPSSYAYDPTVCSGVPGGGIDTGYVPDFGE